MIPTTGSTRPRGWADLDAWVRRGCALIVAAVAAYSTYEPQWEFALKGGADPTSTVLWPLGPLVTLVRCLTVAKVNLMGLDLP
jgi:hypothetical protein